jgi:hypothetical protein
MRHAAKFGEQRWHDDDEVEKKLRMRSRADEMLISFENVVKEDGC